MKFKIITVVLLASVASTAPIERRDPQLGILSGQLNNAMDLLQKQYQNALNSLKKGAAGLGSLAAGLPSLGSSLPDLLSGGLSDLNPLAGLLEGLAGGEDSSDSSSVYGGGSSRDSGNSEIAPDPPISSDPATTNTVSPDPPISADSPISPNSEISPDPPLVNSE